MWENAFKCILSGPISSASRCLPWPSRWHLKSSSVYEALHDLSPHLFMPDFSYQARVASPSFCSCFCHGVFEMAASSAWDVSLLDLTWWNISTHSRLNSISTPSLRLSISYMKLALIPGTLYPIVLLSSLYHYLKFSHLFRGILSVPSKKLLN